MTGVESASLSCDYFSSEPLTGRMTVIRSRSGELLYLVEGTERAILIDTCVGVKGLREFVESLTAKPLVVIVTHGHVDHAMGAAEFDEAYLSPLDRGVYDEMSPLEVRAEYIAMCCGPDAPAVSDEDLVMPYPVHFVDLVDGAVFDVGGVSVEAIAFAGHTPGMTALLITPSDPVGEAILVVGDACNPRTFLFDHNSTSVEAYRVNLRRVMQRTEGRYQRIVSSHRDIDLPLSLFDQALAVCDQVLAGDSDEVPFEFMGHHALLAKSVGDNGLRADGGTFNLVYDPARVSGPSRTSPHQPDVQTALAGTPGSPCAH